LNSLLNLDSANIAPPLKKVYNIGTKKVVSIDESIAKKLNISEDYDSSLSQQLTEDGKGILMRVGKLHDIINNNNSTK
jgi:hypothetical protein